MTIDELKKHCTESEEFVKKLGLEQTEPGFNIIIPRIAYGIRVRVLPGLTGENLGHYEKGTMVHLKTKKVREWLRKNRL